MDLNNFFSFFNDNPDSSYSKEDIKDFKNEPYYRIKIFEKLIINGMLFKKSLINFFTDSNDDLDMAQVDLAGEFMMYSRAWFWINQFDWDDEKWVEDLKKSSSENLLVAVKLSINYFEEYEEYEKCAFLKKIQDFIQNCLAIEN